MTVRTFILWLAVAVTAASGAQAGTIYVTPTGTGSGGDWANATSLTNALQISASNDAIWLAQGVYTSAASGARFTVASQNVALYGGFTTNMATIGERDWVAYPVSLNGMGTTDNVVRVTAANVTLDGLIISNGMFRALSKTSGGALTLANCRIEKNSLVDNKVSGAGNGLGAYFSAGSVLMTNCVVANNRFPQATGDAKYGNSGIGVYAAGVVLDIVDCVFSNQGSAADASTSRTLYGAGLSFAGGTCRVARTEFIGNIGSGNGAGGGAVYLGNGATLAATFSNCLFRGNTVESQGSAGYGGAVFAALNAARTAAFVNCTFVSNTNRNAGGLGGAVHLASGTLNLRNCILWTNRVTGAGSTGHELSRGGGTLNVLYSSVSGQSSPYAVGVVNFVGGRAGDPLFASLADVHLQSPAGRWDPGAQTFVTTDTQYSRCIDFGDPSDPVGDEQSPNGGRINLGYYGGTAQASKSPAAQAPQLADRGATVNYDRARVSAELMNGLLVAANVYLCYGPGDGGLTTNGWAAVLSASERQNGDVFSVGTPALTPDTTYTYRWYAVNSSGSDWTAPNTFLTGSTPPGGGVNVIHVNKNATGAGDGTDWANAYTKIADGLTVISGTRTNVWITGGTYSEGARLNLGTSAAIVGGFAGTESVVAQRAQTNVVGVVTNYTAINGEGGHGCLNITAGSVWLDALTCSNAVLEGAEYGGLRWSSPGTLVANNCRFVKNRSPDSDQKHGLGVKVTAGNVLLTRCVVADNTELCWGSFGFGIYSVGANLTLSDCVVSNNSGDAFATRGGAGAGLYFDNGTLSALRTDFLSNTGGVSHGTGGGGAVYLGGNANLAASFSNCVFRGNQALDTGSSIGRGGAIWANLNGLGKTVTVVNCTFSGNRVTMNGGLGGAICLNAGTLAIRNSIFWTNTVKDGVSGSEIYATGVNSRVTGSYSCLTGTNAPQVVAAGAAVVQWGDGVVSADPLFASATDLHLKSKGGRWDPATATWVNDSLTSPCIDAGDPGDPVGLEPEPNGRKINMGAYGGTVQASRTVQSGLLLIVQ